MVGVRSDSMKTPVLVLTVAAVLALGLASGSLFAPSSAAHAAGSAFQQPSTRVLELVLETPAAEKPEDLNRAKAAMLQECEATKTMAGFVATHVTAMGADPRGGSAAAIRATVWNSVEYAEAASLAMDTGTSGGNPLKSRSYFRLLRESTLMEGQVGHVEVVVFRTKPGVTREANVELFDKGESEYAALGKGDGGLLAHSLWIAPDGRWVHLLYWRSEADYVKTGKALFAKPGVGGWIRSLDFKRFVVYRGDVAVATPDAAPAK